MPAYFLDVGSAVGVRISIPFAQRLIAGIEGQALIALANVVDTGWGKLRFQRVGDMQHLYMMMSS